MNDKSLTMPQKIVSIVVPVYCNEGSLERTYDEVVSQFKEIDYDYEFVFVNDGSTDNSQKILNYLKERDKKVRVMRFTRNFGQMAALLAGLDRAKGDCAITISADLQDPASLIPQMIHHWASGSELVVCSREAREDPYAAKWQSALAYWLLRQAHPQMPKGGFDFVLIGRKALDTFNSIDNRNRYFQGDLLWMGHTISVIPYKRKKARTRKIRIHFLEENEELHRCNSGCILHANSIHITGWHNSLFLRVSLCNHGSAGMVLRLRTF